MNCSKCGKEPLVHDLMIGQKCLELLRKNPEQLLRERKLPPVSPVKSGGGGDGGNRVEYGEPKSVAAVAGS